jgi:peroxiredoxin
MGRLDDIVARNQKALKQLGPRRGGIYAMAFDEIADIVDPTQHPADRRRKLIAAGAVLGVIAAIAAWWFLHTPTGSAVGERAPGGNAVDHTGKRVELSSLWADHRVIVMFYPTLGCDECREGLRLLNAMHDKLDAKVIAISAERRGQVADRRQELGLDFDVLADPTMAVFQAWKVAGLTGSMPLPSAFIVEAGGRVSYRKLCDGTTTCPVISSLQETIGRENRALLNPGK